MNFQMKFQMNFIMFSFHSNRDLLETLNYSSLWPALSAKDLPQMGFDCFGPWCRLIINIAGLRLEVASMLYILDQGDEGTARVSDEVCEWKLGRENRCTMSWSNIFQHEFEHFSSPSRPVPGRCIATDSIHLVAQLCTSIVSLGVSGPCLQGENHHGQIDTLHRTIVFLQEWIASKYLPNHHCHYFGGCLAFLTERQWEVRSLVALVCRRVAV